MIINYLQAPVLVELITLYSAKSVLALPIGNPPPLLELRLNPDPLVRFIL
jgi:hypothetical protein